MKKIVHLFSIISVFFACFTAFVYSDGLTSHFIGQFTGFPIHHQHTGWGTSLYYPKIDPLTKTEKTVKVAVIDSGIVETAKEAVYLKKEVEFSQSSSLHDQIGQGTKIASIIGAKDDHKGTLGLAPNAEIYSYKVVDDRGVIKEEWLVTAVKQAIVDQVSIINLSMVVPSVSDELKNLLREFTEQGGYVVTAAYDMKAVEVLNPLMEIDGVIGVGSFNDSFELIGDSDQIDYYAPYSQEALSLGNQIVRVDGSSYSAAFVSGTIANALGQGDTKEEIQNRLSNFFSHEAIYSKQNFLMKFYHRHRQIIMYAFSGLGMLTLISLLGMFALIILIRKNDQFPYRLYLAEVGSLFLFLTILAFLLLPGQM